jgi:hypothetical protein
MLRRIVVLGIHKTHHTVDIWCQTNGSVRSAGTMGLQLVVTSIAIHIDAGGRRVSVEVKWRRILPYVITGFG